MVRLGPIEKGVPISNKRSARNSVYRFDELGVGDSRVIEGSTIHRVSARAGEFGARHNRLFVCRTEEDGAVRVHRLK